MYTTPPKIDNRSYDDLVSEIRNRIPIYVPGWTPKENDKHIDPGLSLIRIFGHMFQTVIQRLDRVSERHFIEFLNTIGMKLLPPAPAVAPVTFFLSESYLRAV